MTVDRVEAAAVSAAGGQIRRADRLLQAPNPARLSRTQVAEGRLLRAMISLGISIGETGSLRPNVEAGVAKRTPRVYRAVSMCRATEEPDEEEYRDG